MYIILKVRLYNTDYADVWNSFISSAKNATFLFHRDFIEYHQDRFTDFSLMVFKNNQLIALLPANKVANELHSHQGLSYGGLILQNEVKLKEVIVIFKEVLQFLELEKITKLHIKLLPDIYTRYPSQELEYLAFILNAILYRRDVLAVINTSHNTLNPSTIRKRGLKKAIKHNLIVKEVDSLKSFWEEILIPNLEKTHQTTPVHTVEEITKLKQHFPEAIRQFNVYHNEILVAGTTLFITDSVVHAQYISANETRQDLGSLDILFQTLITKTFSKKQFFDFGISNEDGGKRINEGLLYWKESFGARTLVKDFYTFSVNNHKLLDTILI